MGPKERSAARHKRLVAHRAADFKDAENWDLDFWQGQTPEERLSAFVAIRKDVMLVEKARLLTKKNRWGWVKRWRQFRIWRICSIFWTNTR